MPNCKRERAAMNDPRVVALEYRIEHGPVIDWSRAVALNLEEDSFDVRAENGRIRFNLKKHYASEDEARVGGRGRLHPQLGISCGPHTRPERIQAPLRPRRDRGPEPVTGSAHSERSRECWISHGQGRPRAPHTSRLSGPATRRHQTKSGRRQHVPPLPGASSRQGTAVCHGVFLSDRAGANGRGAQQSGGAVSASREMSSMR